MSPNQPHDGPRDRSRARLRRTKAQDAPQARRPVVVGVDNLVQSRIVLEWAAVRAHAARTSLRIVHAYRSPIAYDSYGVVFLRDPRPLEVALQLVDGAARHARAAVSGLEVSTHIRISSPAKALLSEGTKADLIVVGRSRPSRFWPWVVTVNDELARRAPGRVIIVDDQGETPR